MEKMFGWQIVFLKIFFIYLFGCIRSQLQPSGSSLRDVGSFIVACGPSLWRTGFSLVLECGFFSLLQLWRVGCRAHGLCSLRHAGSLFEVPELNSCGAGLVAPQHVGSQFPHQGSNQRPLHCKAYSLPLDHQGSSGWHIVLIFKI